MNYIRHYVYKQYVILNWVPLPSVQYQECALGVSIHSLYPSLPLRFIYFLY